MSGMGRSPEGSPVLATTMRAKRSGCSAASRRPIRPPSLDRQVSPAADPARRTPTPASTRCGGRRCDPRPGRFVRTAEPDEVGANHPMTGRYHYRNHAPIQKRPRRLTVEHQHRIGVLGPVLHPGHSQSSTLVIVELAILWHVTEFGNTDETFVGRAQCLHAREDTAAASAKRPNCPFREAVGRRPSQLGVAPQPIFTQSRDGR